MQPNFMKIIFLFTAFTLVAQTPGWSQEAQTSEDDKIATVNGSVITKKELERGLDKIKQQLAYKGNSFTDDQLSQLRKDVLDNLIGGELLFQESQKTGIKVEKNAVDEQFAILQKRFPSEEEFSKAIAHLNLSEADIKEEFGKRIAVQEYIQKHFVQKTSISPEELKQYYESNKTMLNKPEQVQASHILVKVPASASEEDKKKAMEKMKGFQARLKKGEDFAAIAKDSSECPSSSKGGDLGYFSRGQMVEQFEKTAFSLKPGELSDIVETRFGYHLIKLIDKKPEATVSLEEAQPNLEQYLKQKKIQGDLVKFVEELKQNAEIKRYM